MSAVVRVWTFSNNGMVMAVNAAGEQVPDYQGRLEDVEAKIRRDFPDAEWAEPFDFAEAALASGWDERPGLLAAFRRQAATVLASGSAEAFLGLWAAWKNQDGVTQDDLIDVIKELTPRNQYLYDAIDQARARRSS